MPTDQQRIEDAGDGLSRRQVLARGAVAAGIVWAAPVIRTASAYATSAAGTERPCTKFFLVYLDVFGPRPVRFVNPENGYDELPSADVIAQFRTGEPEPSTTTTSSTSTTTTSSTSSTTTSSTSSTSTTSTTTTTTTLPFKDPTAGLGLFPDDEASVDPRDKDKKKNKKKDKDRDKKRKTTSSTNPDEEENEDANALGDAAPDGSDPLAPLVDDLGLFPDETGAGDPAAAAAAAALPDDLPPGLKDWLEDNPDVPVRYPEVPPMLTQSGEAAWAVLLPEVDSGPSPATHQCRAVKGWAQAGEKYAEFYVDPDPFTVEEVGRRLIFPNPVLDDAEPGLVDNVFVVYCCP